jgi:hypothetical protein
MVSQKEQDSRSGNQGGTHEQHVEAGRQSHKNDASRQSGSGSNQQSGAASRGSQQSTRQPTPAQQPDTRLSESKQADLQSGAGVQGGTPEQHAAAGRQSHKNDKNR